MASGLPQVCKLWLGVSKGMLPLKHLAPQILMAVNYYCWRQLARWLGWAEPAYHVEEGATQHLGVRRNSLQYVGRPDGHFVVRVGTWNLGSQSGKGGKVCDELRKIMIDVCCLLKVRWRGQGVGMLGMKRRRYKLWWCGKGDGVGGVEVMVKEKLCVKVLDVRRAGDDCCCSF